MRARAIETIYYLGTNPFNIPQGAEFEIAPGTASHWYSVVNGPYAGHDICANYIEILSLEEPMFYVVARDTQNLAATKRHASLASARDEAQRLSRKEQARFFILAPLEEYEVEIQPVRHTILGEVRWEPTA